MQKDKYLFKTPSSGREALVNAESDRIYVDSDSSEQMNIVAKVLPLAPSPSNLPWSVENLRLCGCAREQLVQNDVNDCPYCSSRLSPIGRKNQ